MWVDERGTFAATETIGSFWLLRTTGPDGEGDGGGGRPGIFWQEDAR